MTSCASVTALVMAERGLAPLSVYAAVFDGGWS
ncbi:MAG: hypothetical protein IANPNBLG_02042 [Bryobacteraceae bacterium]|nr:hypothetical protein [Bryobacteraceae bacterium]